jgi:hypothetical protein
MLATGCIDALTVINTVPITVEALHPLNLTKMKSLVLKTGLPTSADYTMVMV